MRLHIVEKFSSLEQNVEMKISQIISAFLFLDLFLFAATSNVRLFFHFPRLVAWMHKQLQTSFMGIVLLVLIKKGANLFNLFCCYVTHNNQHCRQELQVRPTWETLPGTKSPPGAVYLVALTPTIGNVH